MITEIAIAPSELTARGLPEVVVLRNLGRIVLLAGPNGSGKSRYLRALQAHVKLANEWLTNATNLEASVGGWIEQLRQHAPGSPQRKSIEQWLDRRVAASALVVDHADGPSQPRAPVSCIDLTYQLTQPIMAAHDQPERSIEHAVVSTKQSGFLSAFTGMHSYLTVVARWLFNAGHTEFQERPEMQLQKQDADAFNEIVEALLGVRIGWTPSTSGATLPAVMGRPFRAD